jgi:hypothetical protein
MKTISLQTDELREAIHGLRKLAATLPLVLENPYEWKWVLIIAHNTLQAYMVCAVKGSAGLGALTEKSAAKWLEAYEKDLPYPEERLDFFLELYKKIKGKEMHQYYHSKPFISTPEQDVSVDKLNRRRNTFTHFTPTGLIMGVDDLPAVIHDVLEIIRFLVKESGNVGFYPHTPEEWFDEAFQATEAALNKVKSTYEELTKET